MNENANEIFDYLPISRNQLESDYIDHLWDAFIALDGIDVSKSKGRPFLTMPFHLLFMLALQFKCQRIARILPEPANLFFAGVGGRDKDKLLNAQRSVFDLALVNERTLPELFRLISLDAQAIQEIKNLIDDRNNNLAHAKGGIEPDPDEKIDLYLYALRTLQPFLRPHNDPISDRWLSEINEEDVLSEFIEARLPDSQLSPADFKSGALILFNLKDESPLEEWETAVSRVLATGSSQGILWLKHIAQNHYDKDRRLKVVQMLSGG